MHQLILYLKYYILLYILISYEKNAVEIYEKLNQNLNYHNVEQFFILNRNERFDIDEILFYKVNNEF